MGFECVTKSIRAVFDACDDTVETLLDEKSKDILFQELVRKVFHARINETIKKYKEVHFGRNSKKGDGELHSEGFYAPVQKKIQKRSEKIVHYSNPTTTYNFKINKHYNIICLHVVLILCWWGVFCRTRMSSYELVCIRAPPVQRPPATVLNQLRIGL